MIVLDKVCKRFGQYVAVDNLSFQVNAGEVLGFLGPNGAGKTTTMRIIAGFMRADSGLVSVCDKPVDQFSLEVRKLIGYVPEGAPLWGEMTPMRFLSFIADVRSLVGKTKRDRIDAVVEQLALQSVLQRPIETLSKGFKRRVALAQALLSDPKILILDEPTDGLDPNQKHQVRELISNLSTDKIVIISTHILEEVHAVCSRAIIIAGGKLLVDDLPTNLQARSRYHNAVYLELSDKKYDYAEVLTALRTIKNVVDIERHDRVSGAYTVLAKDKQPIYSEILQQAKKEKWPLAQLYVEGGRLDDVFRSITSQSG